MIEGEPATRTIVILLPRSPVPRLIDLTVHRPGEEIRRGDARHPDLDLVVPSGASALELIVTKV